MKDLMQSLGIEQLTLPCPKSQAASMAKNLTLNILRQNEQFMKLLVKIRFMMYIDVSYTLQRFYRYTVDYHINYEPAKLK